MRRLVGVPILPVLLLLASSPSHAERVAKVHWRWFVVSTPDFDGPPRTEETGLKSPVPKEPLPDSLAVSQQERVDGVFEVFVTAKGVALSPKGLLISSIEVREKVKQIIGRVRFEPALIDGRPSRVRLRVFVDELEEPSDKPLQPTSGGRN
jgi:hypothetical protein